MTKTIYLHILMLDQPTASLSQNLWMELDSKFLIKNLDRSVNITPVIVKIQASIREEEWGQ